MSTAVRLGAPSRTRAVIMGGGTMGADVAVVLLRAHCTVTIVEPRAEQHPAIRDRVGANLQAIGRGEQAQRLSLTSDVASLDWGAVDLMIECVPENLELKRRVFATIAAKARPDTILASNSSSFPISDIVPGCPGPERMLGLHFFMPAHIVPLVEVVLGTHTDPAIAETMARFMQRCGSVPIMVRKDVPGFIANRLQHALAREAFSLIADGTATAEDIDKAVRFGFGFRYLAAGPIMQKEHAGVDVHAAAAATIYPSLSNVATPPAVLADKPRQGKTGMKSGEGFYQWDEDSIRTEKERYDRALRSGLEILGEDLPPIEP